MVTFKVHEDALKTEKTKNTHPEQSQGARTGQW